MGRILVTLKLCRSALARVESAITAMRTTLTKMMVIGEEGAFSALTSRRRADARANWICQPCVCALSCGYFACLWFSFSLGPKRLKMLHADYSREGERRRDTIYLLKNRNVCVSYLLNDYDT